MGKAVKKEPISADISYYQTQFATVKIAAGDFERHERTNRQKLFFALEKIFEFGRNISAHPDVFEAFLLVHGLPLSKTTQANPYNALVPLAFKNAPSKSWHSECSNVLHFAMYDAGHDPLSTWLDIDGGVTERYKQSVAFFARTASTKARKQKSARLAMAKAHYSSVAGKTPLPGVTMAEGFYPSLVYSDGTNSFVVDVRRQSDETAIEKYLLGLVGKEPVPTHPLAEKALFRFFRAIELICSLCGKGRANEQRFIGLWNETVAGVETTKITLLADVYSFTHATVTLSEPIAALAGKGTLLLPYGNAETFRTDFQKDGDWQIEMRDSGVWLANDAKVATELQLQPASSLDGINLRRGMKLNRQSQHFVASITDMTTALAKNDQAAEQFRKKRTKQSIAMPTPSKFKWVVSGKDAELEIDQPQTIVDPSYPFMSFSTPAKALVPDRYISIADMRRLWAILPAFGEDKSGYIGDGDEPDAAYCLDDTFDGGDHLLYVSPLIVSSKKDRTQVCGDFRPTPAMAPSSSQKSHSTPAVISASAAPVASASAGTAKPAKASKTSALLRAAKTQPADVDDAFPSRFSDTLRGNWRIRLNGLVWPSPRYQSGTMFGAYITSFMPDNTEKRICRQYDLEWQLRWWRRMTDIPVTLIASNWADGEIANHGELNRIAENGGRIIRARARDLIDNRRHSLEEFYEGNHDWGIIMDDDASLQHGPAYNSGAAFFSEMAASDPALYEAIDVFSPFTGKKPSHGQVWPVEPELFNENHVFDPYYDLKGSMYVVRNFRKLGRPEILPPATFRLHGEDTLFGVEAISKGASVYRCNNLVLRELRTGGSAFPDRQANMKIGNIEIAKMYEHEGLKMGRSHLLDRSEMLKQAGRNADKRVIIAKPK